MDEQLHAGDYLYILVGSGKYVNNSVFIWPCAIIVISYFVPAVMDFMTHPPIKTKGSKYGREALFVVSAYALGFVFIYIPEIVIYALHGKDYLFKELHDS